jgi:hypothetical protein
MRHRRAATRAILRGKRDDGKQRLLNSTININTNHIHA